MKSTSKVTRHLLAALPALCTTVLFAAGCEGPDGRLLKMHFSQNRKQEAQQHWDQVRGGVRLQLAEQHLKSGRFEEAGRALEEAMALCPGEASAYVLATKLKLEKGQIGEARSAISVAVALRPEDPEVRYLAGLIAQRYGDMEGACVHFEAAQTLAPSEPAYLISHVESLVATDRPHEALERLSPRLADFDENVTLRLLAARVTRILGLREPTVAHCRDALRISGGAPDLAVELGDALVWAGRFQEAIQVLLPPAEDAKRGGHRSEPGESSPGLAAAAAREAAVTHLLSQAYIETRRPETAMKFLRDALQKRAGDVTAWRLYARAALAAADLEGAAEALARLNEFSEMTAESWLMAGYVALRRGRLEEARDAARRAIAADDRLATAHFLLGEAAEAAGDLREARHAYENAMRLDDGLTVARHRLEMLMRSAAAAGAGDDGFCFGD